jgi:Mg/Co/Ni transporter MgtE
VILAALILAVVALAVVVFVAWPLVRPQSAADTLDPLTDDQRRRLALREERDLALQAIKELEVDRATNHIGDEDYAELVNEYRAQAAAAIAKLDAEGEEA